MKVKRNVVPMRRSVGGRREEGCLARGSSAVKIPVVANGRESSYGLVEESSKGVEGGMRLVLVLGSGSVDTLYRKVKGRGDSSYKLQFVASHRIQRGCTAYLNTFLHYRLLS